MNLPSARPPRGARRGAVADTGRSSGRSAVRLSPLAGSTGTRSPSSVATRPDHAPAASTTCLAGMSPRFVYTASTRSRRGCEVEDLAERPELDSGGSHAFDQCAERGFGVEAAVVREMDRPGDRRAERRLHRECTAAVDLIDGHAPPAHLGGVGAGCVEGPCRGVHVEQTVGEHRLPLVASQSSHIASLRAARSRSAGAAEPTDRSVQLRGERDDPAPQVWCQRPTNRQRAVTAHEFDDRVGQRAGRGEWDHMTGHEVPGAADRAATVDGSAIEHGDGPTSSGQFQCAGQPDDPTADHHDVGLVAHRTPLFGRSSHRALPSSRAVAEPASTRRRERR